MFYDSPKINVSFKFIHREKNIEEIEKIVIFGYMQYKIEHQESPET